MMTLLEQGKLLIKFRIHASGGLTMFLDVQVQAMDFFLQLTGLQLDL
jgi:hypothetical protein